MQIVTDRGMDLAPEQINGLTNVHFAPLRLTLEDKTYVSGVDIQSDEFYRMLGETESFPITSQPAAGEFAELYSKLAKTGEEILSIHISSGLSGTINSARAGAAMVPEARVTIVDTKTLSCPLGWHVQAASNAIKAGWSMKAILERLEKISAGTQGLFTLGDLRYLIHGGRISHLKGLIASLLSIKPVIGPEKENGTYVTFGQEITLKRAVAKIVRVVEGLYPAGSTVRVQLLHGNNPESLEALRLKMTEVFDCRWDPVAVVSPVLGAHTGPSIVGLAVGRWELFSDLI